MEIREEENEKNRSERRMKPSLETSCWRISREGAQLHFSPFRNFVMITKFESTR